MIKIKNIICFIIGHKWDPDWVGNENCIKNNLTIRHCTCRRCFKKDIIDVFTERVS